MVTYLFEEEEDIVSEVSERKGEAFTLDSATVTITAYDNETNLNRKNVAASVSGNEVWFHETFSLANGYSEGGTYKATFSCNCTRGTSSYVVKAVVDFEVRATND